MREQSLFIEALDKEDPAERAAFLDAACGEDATLRDRIERLFRRHQESGDFPKMAHLDSPPTLTDAGGPLPPEGPGAVIGPYKLREVIGEGGMGVVHVAEQERPVRRKVALKVIKPGMDTKQVVARFEAERQALAMMDHPNIAKVFDGGATDSGHPYFVMELVRGIPITEYCDKGRLPIRDRLELFVLVCRAVQHAHQKGIIHRDLKPSNILVTLHDGVPVPKVIDFGIAKATGQSLTDKSVYTAFAQLIGTPLYMSPEQVEMSGLDVDTRSDIYSLGVLLYELLTGTTPFDPETLRNAAFDEMRRIIREDEPPRPSARLGTLGETLTTTSAKRSSDPRRLGRSVRGELDWVAMKALEKDRRRRYETANDFAADVLRYLTDRPVEACPPSAWYRLRKYARRNRSILMTVAAVAIALVAGTGASLWQAVRARDAERKMSVALDTVNRERELAEGQSRFARKAVDEMYVEVAESWLANSAGLTRVQRQFLEKALGYYETFAAARGADPEVRRATATAHHRVGQILLALGQSRQADEAFQKALALRQSLVRNLPGRNVSDRLNLAASLRARGAVMNVQGRNAEAEGLYRQSIELAEALAAEQPDEPSYRYQMARSLDNLSLLLTKQENFNSGAVEAHQRSLEAYESLVARYPGEAGYREGLAHAIQSGSLITRYQGDPAKLEAQLRRSVELLRGVLAESPARVDLRSELAAARNNLGAILLKAKGPEAAEAEVRLAADLYARLSEDYPEVVAYRSYLANSQRHLGQVAQRGGRVPAAEASFRQAIASYKALASDFPDRPDVRSKLTESCKDLADMLGRAGRPADTLEVRELQVATAQSLADEFPENATHRASLAAALGGRGVALLGLQRKEEAEGFMRLALKSYESLAERYPANLDYRRNVASSLNNLAQVVRKSAARLDEAEALLRQALDRSQALADESPENLDDRSSLGYALSKLGKVRTIQGRADEASELSERAIQIQKSALKAAPWNLAYQRALGDHYKDLAAARFALGDGAGTSEAAESIARDLPESGLALAIAARWVGRAIPLVEGARTSTTGPRPEPVQLMIRRVRELVEQSLAKAPDDAETMNSLAWTLANAPEPELRDPGRAVALARKSTTAAPQQRDSWNTLGLACLRAGDRQGAIAAIGRATDLSSDVNGFDQLILALALAQDGDAAAARRHFERVLEWRKTETANDEAEYDLLQSEAEAALGLKSP